MLFELYLALVFTTYYAFYIIPIEISSQYTDSLATAKTMHVSEMFNLGDEKYYTLWRLILGMK
jgi:hypothetical protein